MEGRGRNSKSNQVRGGNKDLFAGLKGWHLLVVFGVGIIVAAYLGLQAMQKAYTVYPTKVFEENFNDKLTDIKDLEGGGEISSYFNLYLKFKAPNGGAHPKHYVEYRDEFASHGQDYFQNLYPNDESLVNANDLELSARSQHDSASTIINSWLLHNKKTGQYYFRTWGQK